MISCSRNDNKKLYLYFFILGSMMIIHTFVDAAVLSTALRGLTQNLQRVGATLDARQRGKGSQRAEQREKRGHHEKEHKARQRQDDSSSKKMGVAELERWSAISLLALIVARNSKLDMDSDDLEFSSHAKRLFIEKLTREGGGESAKNGIDNLLAAFEEGKKSTSERETKAARKKIEFARDTLQELIKSPKTVKIPKQSRGSNVPNPQDVLDLKSEGMEQWGLGGLVNTMTQKARSEKFNDKKIFQEAGRILIEKLEALGAGQNARNGVENLQVALDAWKKSHSNEEGIEMALLGVRRAEDKLFELIDAPRAIKIEKKLRETPPEKKDEEIEAFTFYNEEPPVDEEEIYEAIPRNIVIEEEPESFIEISKLSQKKFSFPKIAASLSVLDIIDLIDKQYKEGMQPWAKGYEDYKTALLNWTATIVDNFVSPKIEQLHKEKERKASAENKQEVLDSYNDAIRWKNKLKENIAKKDAEAVYIDIGMLQGEVQHLNQS